MVATKRPDTSRHVPAGTVHPSPRPLLLGPQRHPPAAETASSPGAQGRQPAGMSEAYEVDDEGSTAVYLMKTVSHDRSGQPPPTDPIAPAPGCMVTLARGRAYNT